MSSLQNKKIKHNSTTKNKVNLIKNMTGMNHPAFKSNNTLKNYINQKLNSYIEPKNFISKTKSFTKFNDKIKLNIYSNNTKISYNNQLLESSNNINHQNFKDSSPIINKCSNSLNKNFYINNKNKTMEKYKNNSVVILKYYHKNNLLNKEMKKRNKNSDYMNKNESPNLTECNQNNNNTPINVKMKDNKTTPINEINKKRSIYNVKKMSLNESLVKNNRIINNTVNRKVKNVIINQKLNNFKMNKNPVYKNANGQIKLFKEEINHIINNKSLYNNIPLNKSYFREDSKRTSNNNTKINHKINYSLNNIIGNKDYKNTKNCVSLLKDKINNLLKNEESFKENECPIPMPYVKRYSENTIKEDGNENINIENILFNKDLKEPKEEKKVPLPISQIINPNLNYSVKNFNKNKKNSLYSNSNNNFE